MSSISFTIIGINEAKHLQELLPQISWADEIVYVDCESEDNSLKIAEDHGCKVFTRKNNKNLNINKSFAMEKATSDWVFYIDPDERLTPELSQEIQKRIAEQSDIQAYRLNRKNHYFGKWLKYGSQYPDVQLRLFRNGKAAFLQKHVHEKLIVQGKIGSLQEDMNHFPYLDIDQFMKKFSFYSSFEAGFMIEQGVKVTTWNTIRFCFFKPITRFIRRYFFKLGFLDGLHGFFCALFDAINIVVRYIKLAEKTKSSFSTNTSNKI